MIADLEIEKEVDFEMVWKQKVRNILCQFSDKLDY